MGFQSSRIPFFTNSFEIDINSLYQKGNTLRNPLESSWYCLWFFRWFIFSLAVFPVLIWAKWYTTAELCLQVSFSRKNFTSLIVKIDFTTKIPWKFWFERDLFCLFCELRCQRLNNPSEKYVWGVNQNQRFPTRTSKSYIPSKINNHKKSCT